LVLAPDLEPERLGGPIGALDQFFLGVAWGSVVTTIDPSRRLRRAVPVGHQVRLCCQVYPASHKVTKIVQVLTWGSPSGAVRRARCNVVSDQVAVPSRAR